MNSLRLLLQRRQTSQVFPMPKFTKIAKELANPECIEAPLPCGLQWSIFKRSSTTSATNLKRCLLKSFDNQCSLHRVGLMDEPLGCPCRANTSRSLCFTFYILLYICVLLFTFNLTYVLYILHSTLHLCSLFKFLLYLSVLYFTFHSIGMFSETKYRLCFETTSHMSTMKV